MTPYAYLTIAIDPALTLLPEEMRSDEARAMCLAIAWQESKLAARRQKPTGPARGYPQFEEIGIAEVLAHRKSRVYAARVCADLDLPPDVGALHKAIEFSDVLAAAFTRLAVWRHPHVLPQWHEPDVAWRQYLRIWAPGKPRAADWPESYAVAWKTVHGLPR